MTETELVAIVGPSGAGKSTIFHLLQHFYEPAYGRVCLDGVNVSELDHQWLHKVVALVGQEPVLFSGSVESNIRYSVLNHASPSREEVESAARAANAHEFIIKLPHGYQTGVGERGVQMSGGQKQRIAIARALLQNPTVLLLDEATSALDTASEVLVQQALEVAMQGRTVVIIAHRLSTVQRASRLLVLDQGRVLQTGTHEALMALPLPADGQVSYRSLVSQQSLPP